MLEHELSEDAGATELSHARQEIALSLEELREVARGIHPAVLTAHGLAVAWSHSLLAHRYPSASRCTSTLGCRSHSRSPPTT